MTVGRCCFLDILPPELRLMVYEDLLVSSSLIPASASKETASTDSLSLSILRVNRQIHGEAAAVFYGKNMIYITPSEARGEHGGLPRPAIAPQYMPLIRRMKLEALYCPEMHSWGLRIDDEGPIEIDNQEAEAYISSLTALFQQTTALRTLHLAITPHNSLPTKEILTSLLPLQDSLPTILTNLPLSSPILLSFEFNDCYYRIHINPDFLAKGNLLLMACKVLFWKGHLQIEQMVRGSEDKDDKSRKEGERTDLGPLVEKDMGYMVKKVGEADEMLKDLGDV